MTSPSTSDEFTRKEEEKEKREGSSIRGLSTREERNGGDEGRVRMRRREKEGHGEEKVDAPCTKLDRRSACIVIVSTE